MTPEDKNHYQNLRAEIKASASGDAWGWSMAWWFAIAGTLHDKGDDIPPEWHFRASPMGGVSSDDFEAQTIAELAISSPALVRMGNVLQRYTERLRRAGLDY